MGYEADESFDVDIYYYDEEKDAWVGEKGEVDKESKEVKLGASNFFNYGVFAQVVEKRIHLLLRNQMMTMIKRHQ